MVIQVWLKESSQPVVHKNVLNTYTKGGLYCVFSETERQVYKYPIANIFRVIETY